jgi:hypothetical protein
MAANPKILRLIESLRDATLAGRLRWKESGVRNYFDLSIKDGAIAVSSDLEEGQEEYFVGLRGDKGVFIEREFFVPGDEGFDAARSLYEIVRRNAYHVDDIIDRVIADLETKK